MTRQQLIKNAYDRIAKQYPKAATLQREIGERLFARLDFLKLKPMNILDLGCGSGEFLTKLRNKYPKAKVMGLDLSAKMVQNYRPPLLMRNKPQLIVADMEKLPIASNSINLIFSNQVIHWAATNNKLLFSELQRILTVDGVILFSTLGPDTGRELKQAWLEVDNYQHVNDFKDMHDLGDELLACGFVEPVVDMEYLSVRYLNSEKLLGDLKLQGDINLHHERNKGLTGKQAFGKFKAMLNANAKNKGYINLTYEIIYGQAWKALSTKVINNNEIKIPIHTIGKRSS